MLIADLVRVLPVAGHIHLLLSHESVMTNSVLRSTAPGSSNGLGNPVVAVPSGFLGDWPTSLHLTGRLFADSETLGLAHAFQKATDHHLKHPLGFRSAPRPELKGPPAISRTRLRWGVLQAMNDERGQCS